MPLPVTLGQTPTQPRRDEVVRALSSNSARDVAEAEPRVANANGVLVESLAVRGWASLGRLERRRFDLSI